MCMGNKAYKEICRALRADFPFPSGLSPGYFRNLETPLVLTDTQRLRSFLILSQRNVFLEFPQKNEEE